MKQEIIQIDLEGVNSYLIKSDGNYILVDTGGHLTLDKVFTNRREKLQNELDKAGVKPGNLKLIILTHGHSDHVANAAYFRDVYQTKIAMHADDLYLVQKLDMNKMMESFHFRSIGLKIALKLMTNNIKKVNQKIIDEYTEFNPDLLVKEDDNLSQYGFDAKIIEIPGHTGGSIGIVVNNEELICGDTFTNTKKPVAAINANDFYVLDKSIQKLKDLNLSRVYPGHGTPFSTGEVYVH